MALAQVCPLLRATGATMRTTRNGLLQIFGILPPGCSHTLHHVTLRGKRSAALIVSSAKGSQRRSIDDQDRLLAQWPETQEWQRRLQHSRTPRRKNRTDSSTHSQNQLCERLPTTREKRTRPVIQGMKTPPRRNSTSRGDKYNPERRNSMGAKIMHLTPKGWNDEE